MRGDDAHGGWNARHQDAAADDCRGEETTMDDKVLGNKSAVATAFASVDFSQYKNGTDAELAVLRRLSLASRVLEDDGIAMSMCDAARINCTIQGIELEQSSQRFVVSFVADKSEDGKVETIRTDRVDSYSCGNVVKALWTPDLVGAHVCLYKHNDVPTPEQIAEARKNGVTIPPQGYRRAVYVRRLR